MEACIGRRVQLQRAPRPQTTGWVVSLAVSAKKPAKKPEEDEQAAADAISAVVEPLEPPEWEPNGRDTAPGWRLQLAGGREADVEVTLWTDDDARAFMASLSPDGSAARWPDPRLSYRWIITVSDLSPDKRDRTIKKLVKAAIDVLVPVEGQGSSPRQMQNEAEQALRSDAKVGRYCGGSRHIHVETPTHVGRGRGVVRTYGVALDGCFFDPRLLSDAIQERIDDKEHARKLDDARDLKWLAVTLEYMPAWLLNDFFVTDAPSPPPILDGISFDYFHEVWVIAKSLDGENYVVLRLLKSGDEQRRAIVPRSPAAA